MKGAASKKRVSEPVSASEQGRRYLGPAGDAAAGGSATFGAEPSPDISLDLLSLEAGMGEFHCRGPG